MSNYVFMSKNSIPIHHSKYEARIANSNTVNKLSHHTLTLNMDSFLPQNIKFSILLTTQTHFKIPGIVLM